MPSRPHRRTPRPFPIRYWFYFPDQPTAELATYRIRPLVDFVSIRLSANGSQWLLSAVAKNERDPKTRRKEFTQIAESLKGEYDGWDSNVPPSFAGLVAESMGIEQSEAS